MAAVLAGGTGALLSHSPAGQLCGLIARDGPVAMHVTIPGRARRDPDGILIHRPRCLAPRDVTQRLGIPTTTPTRTVWDLATILSPLATRRAFEQAEKLRVLSRPRLAQLHEAAPSRRGAGVIRELLADAPLSLGETRSWLEELLLITCRDNALPLPAINVPLLGYEVDFLWPAARFVVEADGGQHRGWQRNRDNERDARLSRAGYLVRRYTSHAMADERAVADEVREILRERTR